MIAGAVRDTEPALDLGRHSTSVTCADIFPEGLGVIISINPLTCALGALATWVGGLQ